MDYSISDSSIIKDEYSHRSHNRKDDTIRVGIVREVRLNKENQTRYLVEVHQAGYQVPVVCQLLTKFGGVHNFEEYRVRGWAKFASPGIGPQTTASTYDLRSGDSVLVAFINGISKEGVILGGLEHAARSSQLGEDIEYMSCFNGLETKIDNSGAYTITFNGKAINDANLDIPGAPPAAPIYNPVASGSSFGFDSSGSFTATNGSGSDITIHKNAFGGFITITSGSNQISLGGDLAGSEMNITSDYINIDAVEQIFVTAPSLFSVETGEAEISALKVYIGNDVIELIDGLIQLIDGLGAIVVTSPVGSCTPIMASPQWALVEALKIKLQTLKV